MFMAKVNGQSEARNAKLDLDHELPAGDGDETTVAEGGETPASESELQKLKAERDYSFYCRCHGSTFDPGGKVTEGPATRNLPVLPTTNSQGHLIVKVPVT